MMFLIIDIIVIGLFNFLETVMVSELRIIRLNLFHSVMTIGTKSIINHECVSKVSVVYRVRETYQKIVKF